MSYDPSNSGEQPPRVVPPPPVSEPVPPQADAVPPPSDYAPPAPPTQPGYQPPGAGYAPPGYQAPTQPGYAQPGYAQHPGYQPTAPQQPGYPNAPVQPPYVGYSAPRAFTPQGYPVASYPGYAGAGYAPPSPGVGGLAIAAIIVSGVAFLAGWMPIIGVVLALAGLLLSIFAVRRQPGRVLGIIGIVLSSLALVTSLLMTSLVFSSFS